MKAKKTAAPIGAAVCAPTGIRTPVLALKGLRPRPLDDEGEQVRILAGLNQFGKSGLGGSLSVFQSLILFIPYLT